MKGKDKCEFLKGIRKRMAEANGIPYEPRVCNFEDDCTGTCPYCEKEAADLLAALKEKDRQGIDIKTDAFSTMLLEKGKMDYDDACEAFASEVERIMKKQERPLMGDIRIDFKPLYSQEEEIRLIRELDEIEKWKKKEKKGVNLL